MPSFSHSSNVSWAKRSTVSTFRFSANLSRPNMSWIRWRCRSETAPFAADVQRAHVQLNPQPVISSRRSSERRFNGRSGRISTCRKCYIHEGARHSLKTAPRLSRCDYRPRHPLPGPYVCFGCWCCCFLVVSSLGCLGGRKISDLSPDTHFGWQAWLSRYVLSQLHRSSTAGPKL